jgi:hypothetical protein
MFQATIDLVVGCTPKDAFDHLARGFFEHHRLWDPSVTSMRKTSTGPIGAGTTGLEGRRFGPWAIASEFEVTTFEPDRRFGFRTTTGPMLEAGEWTIEPHERGSAIHVALRLSPRSVLMRALAPLLTPVFRANVRKNSERMRAALESLVPAAAHDEPPTARGVGAAVGVPPAGLR